MATTDVRIRIQDDEDLVAAREAAADNGVSIEEVMRPAREGELEEQVEPVTAILVGTAVVAGIKMIMDWWGRRKGGLVIDMRPGVEDRIYRDRDLPYEVVVTFPAEGGEVKVDVKDQPDAAEKWVSEVISGGLKSVADVTAAAKKLVGADRVETVATEESQPASR